jgi:peptide/nickel transport system permease protein
MLLCVLGIAAAAPILAPLPELSNPQDFLLVGRPTDITPRPPGNEAILGTLPGQFDVYFSLIWGFRQALRFGLLVTILTGMFGVLYGAVSGYLGGRVNNLMMRIADAFLAFPVLAAVVFVRQMMIIMVGDTTQSLFAGGLSVSFELTPLQSFLMNADALLWTLVALSWMPYARMVNSGVLRLRQIDYILATRALGAGHLRIILRHLLPNTISPAVVLAARDVGGMVVLQATFTFIGMEGRSLWGQMLVIGRNWIVGPGGNPLVYWWTFVPVTLALVFFSLGWSFLGDSLNEWLNPRRVNSIS